MGPSGPGWQESLDYNQTPSWPSVPWAVLLPLTWRLLSGLGNGVLRSLWSPLSQPKAQANRANLMQPQCPPAQEPSSASHLDLPEMEKLLTKVKDKDDKTLNLSKSLSGALDLEQNGHSLPFKVISKGHPEAPLSRSPSRASSRRASSTATTSFAQDQEVPKDYLILAIATCFCPVWPLNLIPLIFSIMSRSSVQQGDLDGARRLGRLARLLSITFIVMGTVIIIVAVTVNFTGSFVLLLLVILARTLPMAKDNY
ncbi:trafficking regulator of GLUT4 1-like [Cynocephalus volans]|uniref:trafficking regulator of GLUT4 1-like n=1 Tax=Cynocephalus volans TaxID=110931 RepID=UPI002FCAE3B6